MKYRIYTDGGCEPNPGFGAWAYVIINENDVIVYQDSGHEIETTSNRMEYTALINSIMGLKNLIHAPSHVNAFSDSNLLVMTFNDWMHKWEKYNWKRTRRGDSQIKNLDLVQRLFDLKSTTLFPFQLSWVKAHNGDKWNEHCDSVCSELLSVNACR